MSAGSSSSSFVVVFTWCKITKKNTNSVTLLAFLVMVKKSHGVGRKKSAAKFQKSATKFSPRMGRRFCHALVGA
jgi:hypothetical protein